MRRVGLVAVIALQACGGAPSPAPTVLPVTAAGVESLARLQAHRACDCVYVLQNDAILIFDHADHGRPNVKPKRIINGADTGLSGASGLAIGPEGKIYVTNGNGSITEYAADATGDAKPIVKISGPRTLLRGPGAIALDASQNIIVANGGYSGFPYITTYGPKARGDALPLTAIRGRDTNLFNLDGVGVDSKGEIFASDAQYYIGSGSGGGTIFVYPPGANGNVKPIREIAGSNALIPESSALSVDPDGRVYVTVNGYNLIVVFAPGAHGNVAPEQAISGSATQLFGPGGIGVQKDHTIFVTNAAFGGGSGVDGVTAYAPGATGNVAPMRIIAGNKTDLSHPGVLAVNPAI